jgi:hypothetical protein
MASQDMYKDLMELAAKYPDQSLASVFRKLRVNECSKTKALQEGLEKLVREFGNISRSRFRKEAGKAWDKVFPEGLEKKPLKGYQLYVKENMDRVRNENPGMSHPDRMKLLGQEWKAQKGGAADAEMADSATETEDPLPAPVRKTKKRGLNEVVGLPATRKSARRA